tara:strand:+ start:34 stop:324 length:291 start_codon:yes stop_codon:yes gene_type:complete
MDTDIFGYLGAFCLTITLIPQIYKTYREKKMDDFSYGFLGIQVLTCIFFLIYGLMLEAVPLIIANIFVLSQTFILMNFKFRYSYLQNTIRGESAVI